MPSTSCLMLQKQHTSDSLQNQLRQEDPLPTLLGAPPRVDHSIPSHVPTAARLWLAPSPAAAPVLRLYTCHALYTLFKVCGISARLAWRTSAVGSGLTPSSAWTFLLFLTFSGMSLSTLSLSDAVPNSSSKLRHDSSSMSLSSFSSQFLMVLLASS